MNLWDNNRFSGNHASLKKGVKTVILSGEFNILNNNSYAPVFPAPPIIEDVS